MMKTCQQCSQEFEITEGDREFLRGMDVPPPTHCYFCRMIRRFVNRNEQRLYHRKCDLTGKQIISAFSADKKFPVYDIDVWWSDAWDPLSFGRSFDFSRPFFPQFTELRDCVPRLTLQQQLPMENSDYCHCASASKNCFLIFAGNRNEDCLYGRWVNDCKNCVDNLSIEHCELCYDCVSCRECYGLKWSRDCFNCHHSAFLRHCTGCRDCFGASNLVNRQYVVFNEQKTKEQYDAFLRQISTGSFSTVEKIKERVDAVLRDPIVKEFHGTNAEHCRGDYLRNCRNVVLGFECDDCEDLRYCMYLHQAKDSMDHSYWGARSERLYECMACGYDLLNLKFCNLCWSGCSDLAYCDHCFSCSHCFGCVGLKKKSYCIFNRQYAKEEYEDLVHRLRDHMRKTGEWGEFFPVSSSVFPYNESLAQDHAPLSREEILSKGWEWREETTDAQGNYLGPDVSVPDEIRNVSDSLCSSILRCTVTQKPFKIVPQELQFYRTWNIPLPRKCFDQRHAERDAFRNPNRLWKRQCGKCGKEMETTYSPDRPEVVYCERCYLETVY